ncbi:hypothetical protein DSO57_1003086 [Entomophthora muscae]|uniref:Uncharacterized protein n=1 Tax=Entomophthora muscae TaxID=34485 RepID=A0ACC2UII8_9FUNG|nr:hypothetical protein DSO57_1003086 [Entomophthora muscae]
MLSFKQFVLVGLTISEIIRERIKSGDGRVQFELTCNATAATCSQVKKVLFVAGECLDNVIKIKKPIVALLNYYDFCHGNATCSSGLVGAASHNDVEMDNEYGNYFYPQALVKQIGTEKMINGHINPYDMHIHLNAGYQFHFIGNVSFSQQQISLVKVVSHEMLHGLGIASFFRVLNRTQNLIMPLYNRDPKGNMRFIQNIFDSRLYIRATDTPLSSIIDKMNTFSSNITNHTALLHTPYIEKIKVLSSLLTTNGSIYFLTNNNNQVDIETGYKDYRPGSSVSHLDGAYYYSKESTMIPTAQNGNGKDSIADYLGWYTAPYGPLALEVLASLGYTLKKPKWGHSLGGLVHRFRQDKARRRKKRQASRH